MKLGFVEKSEYLSKVFLSCLLPFVVCAVFAILFGLFKLCRRSSSFYRNMVISSITIIYFFYPSLTEKVIGLFNCKTIEDESRFYYDLELICWKGLHTYFAIIVGLPMIMLWVLGIPMLGITFLTVKRKSIEHTKFKKNFLILYQGLKPNRYYWEFINALRKVIILIINVLIPSDMWTYRIMIAVIFLLMFLRVQ